MGHDPDDVARLQGVVCADHAPRLGVHGAHEDLAQPGVHVLKGRGDSPVQRAIADWIIKENALEFDDVAKVLGYKTTEEAIQDGALLPVPARAINGRTMLPLPERSLSRLVHLSVGLTRIDGPEPRYDHNFQLGSAIYAQLRDHDVGAANILHDSPKRSGHVLSEIHRIPGRPTDSWFRLGTSSEAVARVVGKSLVPGTDLRLGVTRFRVRSIERKETVAPPGMFVTLSPILLLDKATGQSIVHDEQRYTNILEKAVNAQVENNLRTPGTIRVLLVEPQGVRRRTIRGRTLLVQQARLLLDGPEEQLRFLVDHGIGRSPALAFGMVVAWSPEGVRS